MMLVDIGLNCFRIGIQGVKLVSSDFIGAMSR